MSVYTFNYIHVRTLLSLFLRIKKCAVLLEPRTKTRCSFCCDTNPDTSYKYAKQSMHFLQYSIKNTHLYEVIAEYSDLCRRNIISHYLQYCKKNEPSFPQILRIKNVPRHKPSDTIKTPALINAATHS